jgi:UDP:flavonoid glycosyltransferase YjiC (YdhE family)
LKRALRTFARRAEIDLPAMRETIVQAAPEALLVDVNTWGAQAAAQTSGLPWATWCPFPLPLSSPEVPPFGPGFAPAHGPVGRLRDLLARPVLTRSYARAFVPAVNRIWDQAGLPPLSDPTALYESAPLVLYMTAEPFEYPRAAWPENIVLVGPCAWEPPAVAPDWLAEVHQPIVLVTTSSEFQDDGRLVRCALEALRDEDVHVVATLPAQDAHSMDARPTHTSRCSSRTARCSSGRCARSLMAAWAQRRRRSLRGCRSARCRSGATSSKSPGALKYPAPARAYPRGD